MSGASYLGGVMTVNPNHDTSFSLTDFMSQTCVLLVLSNE